MPNGDRWYPVSISPVRMGRRLNGHDYSTLADRIRGIRNRQGVSAKSRDLAEAEARLAGRHASRAEVKRYAREVVRPERIARERRRQQVKASEREKR